jgi:hypothetical protein
VFDQVPDHEISPAQGLFLCAPLLCYWVCSFSCSVLWSMLLLTYRCDLWRLSDVLFPVLKIEQVWMIVSSESNLS